MTPRTRRFAWIGAGLAALGVAAALVLNAFQSNLVFFFTPSQVAAKEAPQGRAFRIGGMVESGSLAREPNSLTVRFLVTDTAKTIPVTYTGLLPDLFKEGKGVVAQGTLGADGVFHATEVLAKHDENYMPPEAQGSDRRGAERNDHEEPAPARTGHAMIPELGHFALILALLVAIVQGTVPHARRGARRTAIDGAGAAHGACSGVAGRAWPSGAWHGRSSATISRYRTSPPIPTRSCRCSIVWQRRGDRTKDHSCFGR